MTNLQNSKKALMLFTMLLMGMATFTGARADAPYDSGYGSYYNTSYESSYYARNYRPQYESNFYDGYYLPQYQNNYSDYHARSYRSRYSYHSSHHVRHPYYREVAEHHESRISHESPPSYRRDSRLHGKELEIREGLCTAENKHRKQWTSGYCNILQQIVNNPKTCAGRIINKLVNKQENIGQMGHYCSTYSTMTNDGAGKDFYVQLLSAMATVESNWNVYSTGDHGRSRGLLQVSVGDPYSDCAKMNYRNIRNPRVNLLCGACEAMVNLERDGTIGYMSRRGPRGMARSYGPFRRYLGLVQIASVTNNYCVASADELRSRDTQMAELVPEDSTTAQ